MKKYIFPDNFKWGGAISALQSEGLPEGRQKVCYDMKFEIDPQDFHDGVGPFSTSDVINNYKKDVQLMRAIGMNSVRISISWSRLMKNATDINEQGQQFYNDYIDELSKNNIEPMVNLFHMDMPAEMGEKGGWASREVVEHFIHFVKICFQLFGEKVKYWIVHNEPICSVMNKYYTPRDWPFEDSEKKFYQAAFNISLAMAKTINEYRKLELDGKIGIVSNLLLGIPADNKNPMDVKACQHYDAWHNYMFLDPLILGKFPDLLIEQLEQNNLMPDMTDDDMKLISHNRIDFLGINYYNPVRCKAVAGKPFPDHSNMYPNNVWEEYRDPNAIYNESRGWEIYPKALYDIGNVIKQRYNNMPWFVSENGMGVEQEERFLDVNGKIMDDYRIDFIRDHLMWLHKSIEEGANCFGYHLWSHMDNWSPLNAYKNRYGLIRVDRENNFTRSIKMSGDWFRELTIKNGFYWYK